MMKQAGMLYWLLSAVSLGASVGAPVDPSDDFSPMLAAMALIALVIMLVLVGFGIVIAAIVTVLTAILLALGVISSSALIGLFRRRLSSGLRAFHYQVCAILAMPCGVGLLWLGNCLFGPNLAGWQIIGTGALAGICGGLLLAYGFDCLAGMAYRRIMAWHNRTA